jgi:hypothetical protein
MLKQKLFEFSVVDGASVLRLEERRRGLPHKVFMGNLCFEWMRFKVEVLVHNTEVKKFIHSFREGSKAFIVQRGSNEAGRFLGVAMGGCASVSGPRGSVPFIFLLGLGNWVSFWQWVLCWVCSGKVEGAEVVATR